MRVSNRKYDNRHGERQTEKNDIDDD